MPRTFVGAKSANPRLHRIRIDLDPTQSTILSFVLSLIFDVVDDAGIELDTRQEDVDILSEMNVGEVTALQTLFVNRIKNKLDDLK